MVQSKLLLQFLRIRHYFFAKDDLEKKEYKKLLAHCVFAEQAHSNKAILVSNKSYPSRGDALVTTRTLFLAVKTADCLPIFLYHPKKRITAAIHAGWRGLKSGIIKNTLSIMGDLGGETKSTMCAIGPHIRDCCYEVLPKRVLEFAQEQRREPQVSRKRDSAWFLNLEMIAFLQLTALGIRKENIEIIPICTACDTRFYSYRRDGKKCGRMVSCIGLISSKKEYL